jgi:phosphoglycolate/pyridoxal phosphate phosphatase family enzyme
MHVYVFDMDGVLFRMDDPVPDAAETLRTLRNRGHRIFFLTNNSSRSREEYKIKLAGFEIDSSLDEIITSAWATGQMLLQRGERGKSVYVVGERGLRRELQNAGLNVLPYSHNQLFDYVIVGWDREFTYQKMTEAHLAIKRGAQFIATNRDSTYPDSGGRTLPGGGAIVAAIETCTGVHPITIGKPEPYTLELIIDMAHTPPENCIVVGDRLDTDIAIGKKVGARTALALTGVTSHAEVISASPEIQPDIILNSLKELL